jgi:hypothetical protein
MDSRLKLAAVTAIATAPLVPYLLDLARHPVPRFAIDGDYAGLEIATRYAFSGKTLLGPYSRFGWNHPGPLYFDMIAPVYALFGGTSTGLFAGACAINMAAAVTVAASARVWASPAQASAVVFVLFAWLAAFGSTCVLPWNPLVVCLALLAFLVLAAHVARGKSGAAPFAVLFGMLAAQTHLSTAPTVLGVSLAAGVAFAIRRRGGLTVADGWALALAAFVAFIVSVPVFVEQYAAPEGNITKILHFFSTAKEPPKPFGTALTHWIGATAWLPQRLLDLTWVHVKLPEMMTNDPVSEVRSPFATRVAAVWVAAVATSTAVTLRRRDDMSVALLGTGMLASAIALLSLRAVVGETMHYLVFWTTAGSTVAWMGVATTLGSLLSASRLNEARARGAWGGRVAALMLAATLATAINCEWLSCSDWRPQPARPAETVYAAILARLRRTGETPVIHVEAAWHIGLLLLNELTRDGIEPRVELRDRWILGRQFSTPQGAASPLHVYSRTIEHELKTAPCLQRIAGSDGLELLVSDSAVTSCPASDAPATE